MAKSLKFIVKIAMTLLTNFLMDENVERKFCKYFLPEQHRMW